MTVNVLLLDSGMGGLTVLEKINQRTPYVTVHYLMDNANFPYNSLTDLTLTNRALSLCQQMKNDIDIIVIACNTASTLVLPTLRKQFDQPIIGVIPAIKTAAHISQTKQIALLATSKTIERPYTNFLIDDFAASCKVIRINGDELVLLAEEYCATKRCDINRLKTSLHTIIERPDIDTIVLGCTHFPLLKPLLEQHIPNRRWIDSSDAIADRVAALSVTLTSHTDKTNGHHLYHTNTKLLETECISAIRSLMPLESVQRI